jgi:hypothetical protein
MRNSNVLAYTVFMKKYVTFSAPEKLITQARLTARSRGRTLNAAFREWLVQFTSSESNGHEFRSLMRRLRHVDSGSHFDRDEMNKRA